MRTRYAFFICFMFIVISPVFSEDIQFGWFAGSLKGHNDIIHNTKNTTVTFSEFILSDADRRYGISFTPFSLSFNIEEKSPAQSKLKYSFFPIEVFYNLLNIGNFLYLSLFNKIGWQFIQAGDSFNPFKFTPNNNFFYSGGVKILLLSESTKEKWYYSFNVSVFIEYNIYNELSIGMSIDIGGFLVAVLSGKAADEQKKRANEWE
ncbi:hypothetical protein FACS1894151_06550 [Spirochaetia bacterium]|nr:hypothetical protein FACS1894151_06550 [Spirochaetia bacterium]